MSNANIYHWVQRKQQRHGASLVTYPRSFTILLHNLIREYATYHDGSYSVDVETFSLSDKRLVVSYLESAEWYEWACGMPSRVEQIFSEHADHLQTLVDSQSHGIYVEDQEEMRAYA